MPQCRRNASATLTLATAAGHRRCGPARRGLLPVRLLCALLAARGVRGWPGQARPRRGGRGDRRREPAAPCRRLCRGLAGAQQPDAIRDQVAPRRSGAIPFEHRKFGMMGGAALAVAEHVGELPDPRHSRRQQLFHREFGRGVQIAGPGAAVARVMQLGREGLQMRLEAGADLQRRGVDLDKSLRRKKVAHRGQYAAARCSRPRRSARRSGRHHCSIAAPLRLAVGSARAKLGSSALGDPPGFVT